MSLASSGLSMTVTQEVCNLKEISLEWRPFFNGDEVPKIDFQKPIFFASGFGVAAALEPFKMIIAECSDPICFIGGAMGLYRVSIGQREEGFKQVLNAAFAQVGFFVWPMIQKAIRSVWGV